MKTKLIQTGAALLTVVSILPALAADKNYTLHEWGTFTTVIGSDGTHLDGVHREDAPLPEFVYALDAPPKLSPEVQRRTKGLDYSRSFAHVNVRLETPVLYFYTDEAFDAQVEVGFKNGTIGQWYPDRSAGEKRHPARLLDFAKPRSGSIRWDVHVEPAGEDASARVFHPGELPCWLYPRYPDSALVTNAKKETEKYLFYRGLGRMELPVVFSASEHELHARNRGADEIAQWLVFDHNETGGVRWWTPDSLSGNNATVSVSLDDQLYRADWKDALYQKGIEMLVGAGLYRKEADAMMQTWWSSYFETPGLRVFWIVPRAKVDEILPLNVSPAPGEIERVIVGRSEVLRPSFEKRLLSDFAAAGGKEAGNRWASDRFFPAYSARVEQLKSATPEVSAEIPVGSWRVAFSNGVIQNCEILASGKTTVVQPRRTSEGTAVVKDGTIEILYQDDRLERWSLKGDDMVVEHWHPSSDMATAPAVTGVATRLVGATWNDGASSIKVGAKVRLIAYEDANYQGASITLEGGTGGEGQFPLLGELSEGLELPNHWNNRISSIKVIAAGVATRSRSDSQVVLFEDSRFGAASLTLGHGTAIPDLSTMSRDQIRADLEVHEWGTFTVLQGSDGNVIEWYQAPDKLVDLPPFVRRTPLPGKTGTSRWGRWASRMDTIRMETPVLYFYPGEQMDVTVSAGFPMGRITEVFPPALSATPDATVWRGTLLPPDSPTLALVPAATGPRGRHYAAARAVPDAWLFSGHDRKGRRPQMAAVAPAPNTDPANQSEPDAKPKIEPVDHFIFYRGAGNRGSFEISAVQQQSSGTYLLTNRSRETIPKLIALQVRDGQSSWLTVDQLARVQYEKGAVLNQQTITFPAPSGPAPRVAEEIREVMVDTLHAEGLTEAEATAMVATWDQLWFTDPGTRLLAILPQSFADDMVPLTITPTPSKIDRVFVARVELITREQELVLTSLLDPGTPQHDPDAAARQLADLNLGRYAAGGMERANTIISQQIHARFSDLTRRAADADAAKAAKAADSAGQQQVSAVR